MARVRELRLGPAHGHQERAARWARRSLWGRRVDGCAPGGMLLADGVGLGKTYEALGTVATYLSQTLHGRRNVKGQRFSVLVLVPPALVEKWADELTDPARFPAYLRTWRRSDSTRAVAETFDLVAVLRHKIEVHDWPGYRQRGEHVLVPGVYVVNWNLLWKDGRKFTQIHRTHWDAIIVDEAHRLRGSLITERPHRICSHAKTITLLLSATPFQLSPAELQELFVGLFGGYGRPDQHGKASEAASELYRDENFARFRHVLKALFDGWDEDLYAQARILRPAVERLLRARVVRNQRKKNRVYHLVNGSGTPIPIDGDVFAFDDRRIAGELAKEGRLIELDHAAEEAYLRVRDELSRRAGSEGERPFVAGALRQFLSTWGQYRRSADAGGIGRLPGDGKHPKVAAVASLVRRIVAEELARANEQGWIGKTLVFTTFVGSDRKNANPLAPHAHGTSATLKRVLSRSIERLVPKPTKRVSQRIRDRLLQVLDDEELDPDYRRTMTRVLERFAASRMAGAVLRSEVRLQEEAKHLAEAGGAIAEAAREVTRLENELGDRITGEAGRILEQERWRAEQRLEDRQNKLRRRYSTRDLVARFDGAVDADARDLHHRGFNSPFAPLVLIVSSVGQEGIDLQTYCKHVIHYDLEWNPARMEQREGRVDRLQRRSSGAINVYFLVCRGTYDERVFHVMVSRARWHQVLMADRERLARDPGLGAEGTIQEQRARRLRLNLAPA